MQYNFVNHLNKEQREAVAFTDGSSVILAGAGSGKTRVLVAKVNFLIKERKVNPGSIVMITFTNKAADEMKKRIGSQIKLGYIGTFHSFCAYILRRDGISIGLDRNFVIYDDNDQISLIKKILKKNIEKKATPSHFLYKISSAKGQLISPEKYGNIFSDYDSKYVAQVYKKYEKELFKNRALDFDDLIVKGVNLLMKNPAVLKKYQDQFCYFLVDEFQDTNYSQYVLTKVLAGRDKNITIVGDFSQSIYSWRGADIKNLEKFQEDFPGAKVFYLEENYRSTQRILDFAYDIISKNQTHPILKLHTKNRQGEEVEYYEADSETDEANYIVSQIRKLGEGVRLSAFTILYRTNAQSRIFEETLLNYGLPYQLIGGTRFYERKEIKDVLSYLRLIVNYEDSISQERIKKLGKNRWIKFVNFVHNQVNQLKDNDTTEIIDKVFRATDYLSLYDVDDIEDYERLENIKELKSVALNFPNLTDFLEQVALVETEYFEKEKKGNIDGVKLMTLHQAKGLEFPYVFIAGLEEGLLPHSQSLYDVYELEEERRLFYVGITRAQTKLYLTYARRRFIFGRRIESCKSRFIGGDESIPIATF